MKSSCPGYGNTMPPLPTSHPRSSLTSSAVADHSPSRSTISAGMPEPCTSSWRCFGDSGGGCDGADTDTGGTSSQDEKRMGGTPRLERGVLVVGGSGDFVILAGDAQSAGHGLDALRIGHHALLDI